MLAIKLAKIGKTNKRLFRLIISEKSRDPYGRVLEILGSYNPHSKELLTKTERIKYWISQGAQMTATVNNLLIEKEIIKGAKVSASKPGKKNKKNSKKDVSAEKPKETETKKPIEEKKPEEIKPEEKKTEEKKPEETKE
jgi:small subunit ribosomal protein S16